MDPSQDTDFLLAALASLLPESSSVSQSSLLDALLEAEGDVYAAARVLSVTKREERAAQESNKPASDAAGGKKRKREGGLDDWLTQSKGPSKALQKPSSSRRAPIAEREQTLSLFVPGKPSSSSKETAPLLSILRPPSSSSSKSAHRLPPLTLSTPALIADHTPLTLHTSILPPELACRVYYTMLDEAKKWNRNKWWLVDRMVESPHKTSFYVRERPEDKDEDWQQLARSWYNGRSGAVAIFPSVVEEACAYIEKVVNEEILKRKRFSLEWGGFDTKIDGNKHGTKPTEAEMSWRANVAAANCYEGGKEGVGLHSDHLTHLGPYPTIASLSLGTERVFRLREVIPKAEAGQRQAQTFNTPLPHNSLVIMHPPSQEYFKHSIPSVKSLDVFRPPFPKTPEAPIESHNERINITFRFFRPDFAPSTIPKCACKVGAVLRPDMKGRQAAGNKFSTIARQQKSDAGTETDSEPKPETRKGKEKEKEKVPESISNSDPDEPLRYFWMCHGGAQNEGKECGFFKVMDVKQEGRCEYFSEREGSVGMSGGAELETE
ncbi:hypothetical protein BOTBODRAFT_177085 [Botryobasidium botryosum FD-172 SS1]|uniref:Fe2OG dioxygenase domain-containing protein n=1 Tax=Botryobasidium botryosum (strain FD-172 SS1) TaxID=930990 RepID=A0A067MAG1_BOTB1|nr:hypothetical protein BOTBODRAFT_177085 [Botryobasidium botryosum FD-172 SS1]